MAESPIPRPVISIRPSFTRFPGPTRSWKTKSSRADSAYPHLLRARQAHRKRSSRSPNRLQAMCSVGISGRIDRVLQSVSFGGGAVNQTNVFLWIESMPLRRSGKFRHWELLRKIRLRFSHARQINPGIAAGRSDRSLVSAVHRRQSSSAQSMVRLLETQAGLKTLVQGRQCMEIGTIGPGAFAQSVRKTCMEGRPQGESSAMSRGPGASERIVNQLGFGATAAAKEEAVACEMVLLAVPWDNVPETLANLPRWENHDSDRWDQSFSR